MPLLLIGFFFLVWGCSSHSKVAAKREYQPAKKHLKNSDYKLALLALPSREDSFVIGIERIWLSLLAGQPNFQEIQRIRKQLNHLNLISISNETAQLIDEPVEADYFPAEHEVVIFHLLAAMSFAKVGNKENACVDARASSLLLQGHYSELYQRQFDHAGLRLWSAWVLLFCGEQDMAMTNIRVAKQLLPELKKIDPILSSGQVPQTVHVIFKGMGPEVFTNSSGKVQFNYRAGAQLPSFNGEVISTRQFYESHQNDGPDIKQSFQRMNQSIRYTSAHGQNVLAHVATGVGRVIGIALGAALVVGGIAVAAKSNGGAEAAKLIAKSGVKIGSSVNKGMGKLEKKSQKITDEKVDLAQYYRFVRFLPDYLFISFEKKAPDYQRLHSFLNLEDRLVFHHLP